MYLSQQQHGVRFSVQHLFSQICVFMQRAAFDSSAAETNETWQIEILERSADAKIFLQKQKEKKKHVKHVQEPELFNSILLSAACVELSACAQRQVLLRFES